MIEVPAENDVERSVSVMEKVAKFFLEQEDLKRKLFDKELIKTIPSFVFK
jgi:hypothetical protein